MSLLTYQEARPWAKSIRQVVADRTMPPWHADAKPGTFANDSSLSEQEVATLVAWVDQGAPEGNAADLPAAKTFAVNGWKAGTPDLVYWVPETYNLPATVDDEYRCFVMPDKIEQDLWYSGLEVKPGNPQGRPSRDRVRRPQQRGARARRGRSCCPGSSAAWPAAAST